MTSTDDIFKLANQSVDELLREISSQAPQNPSLSSSPTTEPLQIEDVNIDNNNNINTSAKETSVFNGPRVLEQSPIKKSVLAFEPKIGPDELFDRPLPALKPSESDYSVKSMPNLPSAAANLWDSPSARSSASADSERTIAVDEKRPGSPQKNLRQQLQNVPPEQPTLSRASSAGSLSIQKTRPTPHNNARHVSVQSTASLSENDFVSAEEGSSSDRGSEPDSDATVDIVDQTADDTMKTHDSEHDPKKALFMDDLYESFESPEIALPQKRVSSAESAEPEDILAIWSTQQDFQKVHKTQPSFQSVCDPKKYVVSKDHFKEIKIGSPLLARDDNEADDEEEEQKEEQKTGDQASSHASFAAPEVSLERTFRNPLDSIQDTETSKMSLDSINLSDLLQDGEDSFLREIEAWEPETRVQPAITPAANAETLSNVWRRGTLSRKPVSAKIDNESVQIPRMSANEVEQLMILKKMTSNEFQVKEANSKLTLESNGPHLEQRVQVSDARSEVTEDKASAIVPDLSIATGQTAPKYGDLERAAPLSTLSDEQMNSRISSIQSAAKRVSSALSSSTKVDEPAPLVLGEQGRFFLRVMAVRELNLPELGGRNAQFQLVLDNSIHRLTTDYFPIESAQFVPVNKEFELVVGASLEIVLTLKLRYDKPKDQLVEVVEKRKAKPKNALAKLLGFKDIVTSTRYVTWPAEKDPLAHTLAPDGSFAKLKISFDNFKEHVTCESKIFKLDGLNEWQTVGGKCAAPHKVCAVDFNMLFVPRTSEHETLPTSIKSAYEQVEQVRSTLATRHEGYMYQEGGDIEAWTRRFFKLDGYHLSAHHETTKKLRARINLRRVVDVEYVGKTATETQSGRRVYSDRLLLNDAFRLRFANGETIYFGCDSKREKTEWVSLLEAVVARNSFRRQPWVKQMLAKCT
ncbi:hypothetical protein KL937_002362 [Ogataea polymorpha]|nr:hypothetical protein KL937_002362 [Ogataea polymorpha]KAG7935187.1 hypothetical protein KL904_002880 [Ogataea polymorpha]